MNEHGYVRSVHRHIKLPTHTWKINDNYAGGVPDAWYSDVGGDLWVEYKYRPSLPKRDETLVVPDLSQLQLRWCRERLHQGRDVIVVLGTPAGGIVFTDLAWEHGVCAGDIQKHGLAAKAVARVILDHVTGKRHVNNHEQTYPNCCRPHQSQKPQAHLESA